MRVVWLTDIHLNFVPPDGVKRFLEEVKSRRPDAVLLSGDIGESHDVISYLQTIDDTLEGPIYFVLGNHDFYFGSITKVRRQTQELCERRPRLNYLTAATEPIGLTRETGLVGHDGWADGRCGDYERSYVMMNDYRLIEELAPFNKESRWSVLKSLGDEAAAHIRRVLPLALDQYEHVILLTHVPPLREACWHEGRISDDEWAPHFTCLAMGEAILEIMARRPDRRTTVLCGHTHGEGQCQPLPNVTIHTGAAVYKSPAVVRDWEL